MDNTLVLQTVQVEYYAPAVEELQRQLQAARAEIERLRREVQSARDERDEILEGFFALEELTAPAR